MPWDDDDEDDNVVNEQAKNRDAALDRWATAGNQFWGSPGTITRVPSGFYMAANIPMQGPTLIGMTLDSDNLLMLPSPEGKLLLDEFQRFWDRAHLVAERGLVVKRGVLMTGPPGTGKTGLVQLMARKMIDTMDGIAIMVRNIDFTIPTLKLFRRLEPTRPVILLYEDFEALIEDNDEHSMLALLDGEYQIGNVFHVATTNYPERLQARWVNRPGRFDRVIEVGPPIAEVRKAYLEAKAPDASAETIARWVDQSDGWTIAHMREFIVAHDVMGEADHAIIARFNAMRDSTWFTGAKEDDEEEAAY